MQLPTLETEADGITPIMPRGAYPHDYQEDWINLVARRLLVKMPDLTARQRRVLASIAFTRKYERIREECPQCHAEDAECPKCEGSGMISKPTARYVGRDARNRPVVERLEFGKWRRWAIARSGDPADITDPVRPGRPY